ncbi:hypothetical protein JOM56_014404 [Amanita muscaria]
MAKFSPELNQDIPRDVYYLLHDVIDRSTTGAILLEWAELTGEARNLITTLEDLRGSGMYQALYDLLMERFLRKASPVQENRKLLLELQVRCLNTLGERKMADGAVGETLSEAARHCYYYLIENKGASSLDEDGLLFQSLMTIMKFYNRFYNHQRMPGVPDCVGTVIATVIRRTQIKGHNASFCFQVLNQFKLMLEGVYQRVGDFSSQNPNANLRFTVQLLHRLDLRTIKKWEIDIQRITGNHVPLLDEMVSLMEKLDPGQEGEVVEVKGQLDAFHKGRPWRYERAF